MDLGIEGRRALVCASTQGLGRACAEALAAEGVAVTINGRDPNRLASAVEQMRAKFAVEVTGVAADVTTEDGRTSLLAACPTPDILVNNNAGPPPGDFADHDADRWEAALDANMIAPILLVRAVLPAMRSRRFGRIVSITSAMVTTPHPSMTLSSGARAGLTAVLKGISLEVAQDNVTINNLLPRRVDTDRQIQMAKRMVERDGISFEEARSRQADGLPAKRLGDPAELGAACAFLCSRWASFISGQNIHLDGGAYPGLV